MTTAELTATLQEAATGSSTAVTPAAAVLTEYSGGTLTLAVAAQGSTELIYWHCYTDPQQAAADYAAALGYIRAAQPISAWDDNELPKLREGLRAAGISADCLQAYLSGWISVWQAAALRIIASCTDGEPHTYPEVAELLGRQALTVLAQIKERR